MGKRGPFRPNVSEALEGRLLLSGATEPLAALIDSGNATPAAMPPADAYQVVRTAYNGFIQEYYRAVESVLLVRGSNGAIDPVGNRRSFDRAVSDSLDALSATLSDASDTAAPNTLAAMRLAINGMSSESLRGRLEALITPSGEQDATPRMFVHESLRTIATSLARTTALLTNSAV